MPLRHVEYAANLTNCYISASGWGTAITQVTTYAMMDRLGIAQWQNVSACLPGVA